MTDGIHVELAMSPCDGCPVAALGVQSKLLSVR